MDTITLVQARHRRLAKMINADWSITDYDSARTISLFDRDIADLDALARLLTELLARSDIAVVRGAIADRALTDRVRRLLYTDRETGETPTLSEVPRRWVALDMDGLDKPDHVSADDLLECAKIAVQRLPSEFRGVRCIIQASSSHGIKPGIRMRLWFWLDRPTDGSELKRWMRSTPVDPSVFGAAQLIYTAAPVFAAGLVDHLRTRIILIPGEPLVAVPSPEALAPRVRAPASQPIIGSAGGDRYAFAALRNAVMRISSAGIGSRHPTILSEARSLARFVDAGLLTWADVRSAITSAAEGTGKLRDEVDSVIDWAFEHPVGNTTHGRAAE